MNQNKLKHKEKPKKKSCKAEKKICPPGKVLYKPLNICVADKLTKIPKGKVLYDVKKEGVMLAHTYKDPKTGKIKVHQRFYTSSQLDGFLSEKYDGYGAIWDWTRF